MNTLHFKYALEVEKTGSITQAADNLYMGQPSLSKAIKELEDTLHIEIFKRSSRGMVPTEEGAKFLQYARNVLIQLDKMEQIASKNDEHKSILRIAFPHSSYLSEAARAFSAEILQKDSLELHFCTMGEKEVFQQISEDRLNFAVIRISTALLPLYKDYCKGRALKAETLWEFEEQVLLSEKAPFSPGKILPPDALSNFTSIAFPKQDSIFSASDTGFPMEKDSPMENSRKPLSPSNRQIYFDHYADALSFLSACVTSYLIWEPLSKEQLENFRLRAFPIKDGKRYMDLLLYSKEYPFRDLERLFIDKLYGKRNQITF